MPHVFISSSTKDQEYADKLAQKLGEEGFAAEPVKLTQKEDVRAVQEAM